MIVCLSFTIKYMKDNDRGFNFNNLDTQTLKDRASIERSEFSKDNVPSNDETTTEESTENKTTEDSKNTKRGQRPSRPSNNMRDRKDFNFDNTNLVKPNQRNKSNDLLLVLYGLESAVIGAVVLFIIMNNIKTKKK